MTHVDFIQMNPENRTLLPTPAFSSFQTRYRKPELSEGFQDITEVKFQVGSTSHYSVSFSLTFSCSSKDQRQNELFGIDTGHDGCWQRVCSINATGTLWRNSLCLCINVKASFRGHDSEGHCFVGP